MTADQPPLSVTFEDLLVHFKAGDGFEERYFTVSYSPVPTETEIGGIFIPCVDTTEVVLARRRTATLTALAAIPVATTANHAFTSIVDVLGKNPHDLPFVLAYAIDHTHSQAQLMAAAGIDARSAMAPNPIEPANLGAVWPLAQVLESRAPLVVSDLVARFGERAPGPWEEPTNEAILLPLGALGEAPPNGVLVVGLNRRRPLDRGYREFLDLVGSQVSAAIISAHAFETSRESAHTRTAVERAGAEAALRESEERQAFVLKVSDALRPLADPLAIIATASELVGRYLDAGRCGYGELPPPHDHFLVERDWTNGMPSHRGRWRLADFGDELVSENRAGRTLVIDDGLADERSEGARDALQAAGDLRASIGVPLIKDGKWVAAFFVHDSKPRRWTKGDVEVVEDIAERTWAAVERARAEAALRESEEKYRTVFESMDEGFLVHEMVRDESGRVVDSRLLEANPAHQRATGLPPATIGKLGSEFMPDVESHWLELFHRVSTTGVAERAEMYNAPTSRWYNVQVSPIRGHDRVAIVFDDVTVRKQAELALKASAERQAFLLKLSDTLRSLSDANAIKDAATRLLVDHLGVTEASYSETGVGTEDDVTLVRETAERTWAAVERAGAEAARERILASEAEARRQAEEALRARRESEERFRMLADNIAQLAWTCDSLGNVTWYNQRWLDYTGLPFEEMKGWSWTKVLHPDHVDRVVAGVKRSDETGEPWTDTFPLRGKEGKYRWFLSRAIPIHDERGERAEIVRWFGTNTDVTELREANRAKDEFLAMLGHELRNPLAPIVSTLELMRLEGGRKWFKERDIMVRQARHLAALLDDLLDVARLARGKVELDRRPMPLDELIDRAVEATGPLIEERRHKLDVDVSPGLLVSADEKRMVQVISNLLTNAAHYTPPGGHVWINAGRDGRSVVLRVRDDGEGIAAELLPRVFERFEQGPRVQGRAEGGLGLGLAIVRSLVELHEGTVTAASNGAGKGSEFTVRIPAARARRAPRPPAKAKARTSAAPPFQQRILLVDDNRSIADVLALLLGKAGHTVEKAYDGLTALDVASRFQPTVAILDIGLPDMSGHELAKRLRKQKGLTEMALVATTGYNADADRQRSKRAGFAEHLAKPVELDKLLAAIDRITAPATAGKATPRRRVDDKAGKRGAAQRPQHPPPRD